MAEAALGFVCAALIMLYGRSRGHDHIERWTLALVMLGLSAAFRIIALGGSLFGETATGLASVFFVIFSMQVVIGAQEYGSKRPMKAATNRRVIILGALGGVTLVLATGSSIASWAQVLGLGGVASLVAGVLVLREQWNRFELGGVVFSLLICGGGAGQLVAAVVLSSGTRVDLEGPLALSLAAVVLALVIGVLDEARVTAVTAASQTEHLAYHDPLTGLPNRALFHDRLSQALAQRERANNRCAVLFLDLDRFKDINDTLGHAVGDEFLKAISSRVRDLIRQSDTLSRFGGDEFTVLLPNIDSAEDALRVARKITEGVPRRVVLNGRELFVTCSVGIAMAPEDGTDPEVLIRNADAAMYRAKHLGRNTFQIYEPSMNADSLARLDLEARMLQGLEAGEFLMHYQVGIDRKTAKVASAEALVRWRHPELGLLLPANFLGVAERSGLIHRIGAWGIRRVCRDANRIRANFGDDVVVAVNVTAGQVLAHDFYEVVSAALADTLLPGRNLALEISESTAIRDLDPLKVALARIRKLGVQVVIDDFGSGLWSVTRLSQLPHDAFKLDKTLVAQIGEPSGEDIVRAVLNLAHTLGRPVTAEGVETESQLSLLVGLGCEMVQGNLISAPVPLDVLMTARAEEFRTSKLLKDLIHRAGFISLERTRPVRELRAAVENSMN